MVCARLEFGREVESGGKGGEEVSLHGITCVYVCMCVCVCACLGFGREVEGKGGERSVLTWDRVCVCVFVLI